MNVAQLSNEQRTLAVQRLTALWAFSESGLGGVLHALQVPFTGLVVGGYAVIIITLIAYFSSHQYSKILQSLLIVLIVKAAVSPHTPFPAYVAVSFQAVVGFVLFGLMRINFLSILLLSVLAMIESAIQKLLILTLFFGKSLWKATDELGNLVAKQLSVSSIDGSKWVIGIYLFIYVLGGILIAFLAYKMLGQLSFETKNAFTFTPAHQKIQGTDNKKKFKSKLLSLVTVLFIISVLLIMGDSQSAAFNVLKTIIWTMTAVVTWYIIISPLFTKLIHWVLRKRQDRYSEQIGATLSFIPILKQLTAQAWKVSSHFKGWHRLSFFIITIINWSLTYQGTESVTSA